MPVLYQVPGAPTAATVAHAGVITVAELASAIRVGNAPEEIAEVERLRDYGLVAIERHLGAAFSTTPTVVVSEALVRLAGYLFDQPQASRGDSYANPMRNSGAARMLAPYVVHRLGTTAEES